MRVTIGSRPGASGATISPVRRRSLKTAPLGAPPPIFCATPSPPRGGPRLPAAPGNVAKAELRSRDRVGGERRAILQQRHSLLRNADDYLMTAIDAGAGSAERDQRERGENVGREKAGHGTFSP